MTEGLGRVQGGQASGNVLEAGEPRQSESFAFFVLVSFALPTGSIIVPGLYLGSYKVIPKRNYYGTYE